MATSNEGLVTLKSFAERKGWRINQRATKVVARGKEGSRLIHFWTNAQSTRLPGFTFVAEHRSGLSLEVGADYRPRPLMTDYKVEIAPDGSRQIVRARSIAPDGMRWFETHARNLPPPLRPLSAQIRRWAISDDHRRQDRLSATSQSELEHLVQSWRANAELINAVIEADPSSSISVRLMAFAQAGMEAESILEEGHRT